MRMKFIPLLIALSFLSSCRSLDWKRVREQNTIISYETFLKKYPSGSFSVEAREALRALAWERAKGVDSVEGYKYFIERYPESEFKGVARRLMDKRAFKNAEEEGTIKGYREFIRSNPKSRHLKRAKRRIDELSWEDAKHKDSVKGYEKFIESNQDSPYKRRADDRRSKLGLKEFEVASFNDAKKEDTLDSYRVFMEIYPRGVYSQKAIRLMIPLLPELMGKRVHDLISNDPLAKARGVLALKDHKVEDLLLITTILINTLDNRTPMHPEGRVWEKSTTIGNEIKEIFRQMGKEALPHLNFALLLGGYLNSRYSDEVRVKIVETLEIIGDREAVDPLMDLLEIKEIDYKVKLEAIKALLSRFKEERAEELSSTLLTDFLNHKDESVRWKTVQEMPGITGPAIITPLIRSLKDKNPRLRREKIRLLGETGDIRAVEPLIAILNSDDTVDAKVMAAEGLYILGNRQAIEPFLDILASNVRPSLRRKAIKGLVKLYNPETDEEITSELTLLSKDPDPFISLKAKEALLGSNSSGSL